ncbi:type VI secretion protein IcmF [Pseudomonas aeruginosa]|nr:type VI secretion protein IcmF [Pseudomonas aeruginosa]
MSGATLFMLVLLLVLLALLLGALGWWWRTRGGTEIRSFYAAVRQMEREQGWQGRYEAPWLLMLGNETEGEQLCATWRLLPVARPAWFGRWWSDGERAILLVPESVFLPDEGLRRQSGAWLRLLRLFLRLRGRRALDGVVWNIPLARLQDGEQAANLGLAARRRYVELTQRLGLSLPVYVVITGLEDLPGFQELLAALPEEARERALGWSSPFAAEAAWQSRWCEQALEEITATLTESIVELGTLRGQVDNELYCLPPRLESLRGSLQALLEPVFQGNARGEAPRFRGLYLSGSEAAGAAADEVLPAVDAPRRRSSFASQLWARRILAEEGLAQAVPRILQLRQRWQRGIGLAALCLCLLWGGLMTWVWRDALRDAGELSQLLHGASERYQPLDDDTRRAAQVRQNVQAWWQLVSQAPRWRFTSLAFPSSWFSSLDARIDNAYRRVSERLLVRPLRSLLEGEASDLRAIRSDGQPGLKEGDDPSQWKDYLAAKDLVARATTLERHNRLFAQAIDNRRTPLDDLLQLSNDALGSSYNAGSLARLAYYNRTLFAERPADLAALDLGRVAATAADNFHDLMARWLNAYFLTDSLERTGNALTQELAQLGQERDATAAQLLGIGELINHLQQQVNRINLIWGNGVGQDLVPGYQNLLKSAQQSSLLGNRVEELQNLTVQLQQQFRSEWIAPPEAAGDGLLVKQGATLKLADDLLGLKRAIDDLKTKDFVSVALADKTLADHSLLSIDDIGVTQALSFFNDFTGYYESTLPSLNPRYRYSVLHAAASAATEAMWQSLGPRSRSLASRNASRFDVQVKQVQVLQAALLELQDLQAGARLLLSLNALAVADIGQALRDIDEQAVLREPVDFSRWSGAPNFGLQMFRAQDSAELKQSLNSQFNAMATVAERHAPALEWLQAQQSSLATADYNAFVRFSALNAELQKFKADNPASTAAQLAKLVGNDFNQMDIGSCADILNGVLLPSSRSDLATRLVDLRQGALGRCQSLQQQQAAQAWKDLADYFNQYLAGRFPFAYSLEAADAEPGRVRHLLKLMETRLPQVREGLAQVRSPDLPAAEDFVRRLEQAQRWLGPLFERDKSGLLGVALDIDWRSDRSLERGADQVIAWSLYSGDQESRFPGAQDKGLTWNVGDPLKIMLRWAKNGSQRPADDPRQASLAVADLEAGWSYQGSWALLRMMRAHFSRQRPPNVDYTEFPLVLQLPVYAPLQPGKRGADVPPPVVDEPGRQDPAVHPAAAGARAAIAVRDAVAGHRRQHRRYPMTLPLSGNALSLEVLLEPIDPGQPCGPSLRYDPDYDRLRELRREDDSSLPTGVWQAEAKRADWAAVEQLASELLQRRSKDLMLAAWLGEAWLQRGGLGGLQRALVLLAELCERYPEEVHPQAQDGDQSWRGAAHRLAVAPLCRAAAHAPAADGAGRVRRDHPLCLAEVAAPAGRQRRQQERQGGAGSGATSAEEARRSVARGALVQWQRKQASLLACQQQLLRLEQWCDRCLGELAPSCQPLREVIAQWLALAQGVHRHAPASAAVRRTAPGRGGGCQRRRHGRRGKPPGERAERAGWRADQSRGRLPAIAADR